jgi:site-specific DNA recombinase
VTPRQLPLPPRRSLLRIALDARVSTTRQAQAQTIDQQLTRLRSHIAACGDNRVDVDEHDVFRDAGYSGARLNRPGRDRLRARAGVTELDRVVVTAPDRLARKYGHQVLLIEELEQHGCAVEFLERPAPHEPGSPRPVAVADPGSRGRI